MRGEWIEIALRKLIESGEQVSPHARGEGIEIGGGHGNADHFQVSPHAGRVD